MYKLLTLDKCFAFLGVFITAFYFNTGNIFEHALRILLNGQLKAIYNILECLLNSNVPIKVVHFLKLANQSICN